MHWLSTRLETEPSSIYTAGSRTPFRSTHRCSLQVSAARFTQLLTTQFKRLFSPTTADVRCVTGNFFYCEVREDDTVA